MKQSERELPLVKGRDSAGTASEDLAELKIEGIFLNAVTTRAFNNAGRDGGDLLTLIERLRKEIEDSKRGCSDMADRLLISQTVALDGVFNAMMQCAKNCVEYPDALERYMRLGLKAQTQCRGTLEALSRIKDPSSVAFVRQANITSGPQQINNGTSSATNQKIEPNELLEVCHEKEQRLGSTTPRAAVGSYSQLEALGSVKRTQNRKRQGDK